MPEIDPAALTPLIAFALWCVLLMFSLGFARAGAMRRDKRSVETFKPLGDAEPLDAHSRAHMNAAAENLPIFAVVYMSALWVDAAAPIAALGRTVFAARVFQSSIHIMSRSPNAVRVRALMQLVQSHLLPLARRRGHLLGQRGIGTAPVANRQIASRI